MKNGLFFILVFCFLFSSSMTCQINLDKTTKNSKEKPILEDSSIFWLSTFNPIGIIYNRSWKSIQTTRIGWTTPNCASDIDEDGISEIIALHNGSGYRYALDKSTVTSLLEFDSKHNP